MRKIYFAGAIRGGRNDKDLYLSLIQHISQHGEVLTEHVGDEKLTTFGENHATDAWIYTRDMAWLQAGDILIAEVSTPSLGVGYEIAKAEEMGKKILCLYRVQDGKRLSAMIAGSSKVNIASYETLSEAIAHLDAFFIAIQ